jgi:hypothetical protein
VQDQGLDGKTNETWQIRYKLNRFFFLNLYVTIVYINIQRYSLESI